MRFVVVAAVGLACMGGVVWLQRFLSKKGSWWPGLVLPGVTLLIALLMMLSVAGFTQAGAATVVDEAGVARQQAEPGALRPVAGAGRTAVAVFLVGNVPTAALLAIYGACRGRRKALGKMSAQDL